MKILDQLDTDFIITSYFSHSEWAVKVITGDLLKVWVDSDMGGREYIIVNNHITYLNDLNQVYNFT